LKYINNLTLIWFELILSNCIGGVLRIKNNDNFFNRERSNFVYRRTLNIENLKSEYLKKDFFLLKKN